MRKLFLGVLLLAAPIAATQAADTAVQPAPASNGPSRPADSPRRESGVDKGDQERWPKWISDGIATLNLLIVIYVFASTKRSEQRNKRSDYNRAVALFWIQDLVLKNNLEKLHAFFDKHEQEIANRCKECGAAPGGADLRAEAQKRIASFKTEFHDLKHKVLEPLCIASDTFTPLREVFSEIEDVVTTEYARIVGVGTETAQGTDAPPLQKFRNLRLDFFKKLQDAQRNLINLP